MKATKIWLSLSILWPLLSWFVAVIVNHVTIMAMAIIFVAFII